MLAGRLIPNSVSVYADYVAGFIPVSTYTRVSGKITFLGVFKVRTVSYTTCAVVFSLAEGSIRSSDCKYKTKL